MSLAKPLYKATLNAPPPGPLELPQGALPTRSLAAPPALAPSKPSRSSRSCPAREPL